MGEGHLSFSEKVWLDMLAYPERSKLREPLLRDDAFLADLEAASQYPDPLHLWWLGQSGFLLQWQGRRALLDPYLSDSLTRKYAKTDTPHVRMTRRVIDPARLNSIDVVTSSHNHTDHLDAETLKPLMQSNPEITLVVAESNRHFVAERLGIAQVRIVGVDAGQHVTAGSFTFHAVPAAHEAVEKDQAGHCRFVGFVVEVGPYRVYHSGDTLLYEGMTEALRSFQVDVALLPINGRAPERRVAGNLSCDEAAELGRAIGARLVIPCHYDMFEFNTADPADFEHSAQRFGQPYRVLQNGERLSLGRRTD